jgi:hypothetical protein
MKEECILHIGMHKTGSSSIQATLYENFIHNEYEYLRLRKDYSVFMYTIFQKDVIHPYLIKKGIGETVDRLRIKYRKELEQKILGSDKSRIIISGEGIVSIDQHYLIYLRNFLSKYFKKTTVIAYVRPPVSYIQSHFQQKIKNGFDSFNLSLSYPNYRDKFGKFDKLFGKENVLLFKFDPNSLKDGDVVHDFLSRLDVDISSEKIIRVNDSLSLEAIALIYIYRKFGPNYGAGVEALRKNKYLISILREIGNTKFKLSQEVIKPILDANRKDIVWMQKRLGEDLIEVAQNMGISSESELLNQDFKQLLACLTREEFVVDGELSFSKIAKVIDDKITKI